MIKRLVSGLKKLVIGESKKTESQLREEQRRLEHERYLQRELDDFPRSNDQMQYVYLRDDLMKAILANCEEHNRRYAEQNGYSSA